MKTRILVHSLFAAVILLSSGCATQMKRADYRARLAELEVSPDLQAKVRDGDRLELEDIEALSGSGAEDVNLNGYLRRSGATYDLRSRDVTRLKEAGVSEPVIDTLLASRRNRDWAYRRAYPPIYGRPYFRGRGWHPYYGFRYGYCY